MLMDTNIAQWILISAIAVVVIIVAIYVAKKLLAAQPGAKETYMLPNKVWVPQELQPLLEETKSCTGGYLPIFSVVPDDSTDMPSSLHVPTLYPQQTVPSTASGNWGSVARGLFTQARALKGIPELKSIGDDMSKVIARDINEEIESLAAAKKGVRPIPPPIPNLVNQTQNYLDGASPDRLEALDIFWSLRLCRLRYEEHPQADKAIALLQNVHPNTVVKGGALFNRIKQKDLDTAAGKADAIILILDEMGFDRRKFYSQQYQFLHGQTQKHSLEYFHVVDDVLGLVHSNTFPHALVEMELPFHIPAKDGAYSVRDNLVFIVRKVTSTPRASWQVTDGTQIEALMDPTGLYQRTKVLLSLTGRPRHDNAHPPDNVIYRNLQSYPEFVRESVKVLNELIATLRVTLERCDIPDVVPGHFNKCSFRQFGDNADIEVDIPMISLEWVKVSAWAPCTQEEINASITDIRLCSLSRELTEAAKYQVLSFNPRRAILEFAGAFEAFLAEYVSPKIGDLGENTKDRFLRLYGPKLSAEIKAQIADIESSQNAIKAPPTVYKIIQAYKRAGITPVLDAQQKRILKAYEYRNDAAHGRPIPHETLDHIVEAIGALDELHTSFESAAK